MRSWDWKTWCNEADPGMHSRETKVIYIARNGTKFYRQNFEYEFFFKLQSPNGTVYEFFVPPNTHTLRSRTSRGKSAEFIPFKVPNGTTLEFRVDDDGYPYATTTSGSTESTRQYLAREGQSYYLKMGNSGEPYLETFA